ncbi:MAG: fibronectin type III domain-containing protein, partial [Micrococcales bacterium]|nr:fibronectin type III domain-containing protein [Micrococcales bacterium]
NDEQPDGEDVTLAPELASPLPSGGGLLFASGDRLRYLAPKAAGNYSAVYRITSAGQSAEATVRISVREKDAATNTAPVPNPVTARVTAGETVRIAIPLVGIDPDGDAVQLIGQSSSPQKGTVQGTGEDWFDYEAGAYSSGTDEFTYTVMDGLGLRATGTVRVGVSPRAGGVRNPIAVADEVTVRPGKSVTVQVLANDSDPDGGALTVSEVDPNQSGAKASIVDGRFVRVTPPAGSGARSYGLIYTITNDVGGSSSSFVTVRVDPKAPPARPIASDTVLTVTDVLGRPSVDVPVLDNVFFPDGSASTLGVALLPGWEQNAQVLGNKRIRVTIGQQSQTIPFAVSNPDDVRIKAFAFIRVPGLADALPQLNTRAPSISVKSEQSVTIDLNDYVVAIGGGRVRITDSSSVTATHSNGAPLVVDDATLVFTSANQYFGPASITFEVTDGDPSDPRARRAVLTLPIKVLPRTNQPPVFLGAALDFEQGQQREIDLVKLTDYPYANDLEELQYLVQNPQPTGFSYQLNGQRLVITAANEALTGATSAITLGVKDALNPGKAGRIDLRVVPSTRPLAAPQPDTAIAPRGQSTTVDVLANDGVGNPFPGTALRVVKVAGADQGSLPTGVSASASSDRSRITVSVDSDAPPTDVNLQYQVADATNDPSRYVWTTVRISVQDRPDPVSGVTVAEFGDRTLRLSWQPGLANNSPISKFQVTETSADDGRVLSMTDCAGSASCTVTTPGNGPGNAVRLSVVAVNAIGASDATTLAGSIWSDIIPPPPTGLAATPLNNGLRVTWSKPDDGGKGSPITFYVVTVGGVSTTVAAQPGDAVGTEYSAGVQSGSIPNGSATGFTVSARNSAPNSLARWNSASGVGTPAGPPIQVGSPRASTPDGTTAAISWDGVFADNGRAIIRYYAVAYTGRTPSCTVDGVDSGSPTVSPPSGVARLVSTTGTSAIFTGLTVDTSYSLQVFAYNGQGCTASPIAQVTPRQRPGDVTGASFRFVRTSEGTWDYQVTGLNGGPGVADAAGVIFQLVGDGVDGTASGYLDLPSLLTVVNGSQYGKPIAVRLLACQGYPELATPLCSANWSNPLPVGVPTRIDLADLAHQDPQVTDVPPYRTTWSWTSSTAGPGYPGYAAAEVSCDGGAAWQPLDGGAGFCDSPETALPTRPPDLLVRVTTTDPNAQTVERTFPWSN